MAAKIIFLNSSRHLDFFGKLFFRKTFVLTYQIKKLLTTSRVLLKNLILIHHLGSVHHFWLI
jgi:hypothetical protein